MSYIAVSIYITYNYQSIVSCDHISIVLGMKPLWETVRSNIVHSHYYDFANPIYLVPAIVSSDLRIHPKYYLLAIQLFSRALSVANSIYSLCFCARWSNLAPFRSVVELDQSNIITTNAAIMSILYSLYQWYKGIKKIHTNKQYNMHTNHNNTNRAIIERTEHDG
jgi:hypothetical protein